MKVCLIGKHSNKTPFFYSEYRTLFRRAGVKYVDSPQLADVVVLGFRVDLFETFDVLYDAKLKNEKLKIIVLSEEPLWDVLWSPGFENKVHNVTKNDKKLSYVNLNHFTSDIFSNTQLPYFITTDNRYLVRYSMMFKRNSLLTVKEIMAIWESAEYKFAAIAEHRAEEKYEKECPNGTYQSLNKFRTLVTEACSVKWDCLIEGKGWNTDQPRQNLVDWHLDKLVKLDKKCLFISAFENTMCDDYLTEKVFDAFACLGVPVFYETKASWLNSVFQEEYPFGFRSKEVKNVIEKLDGYKVSYSFAEKYIEIQKKLASQFNDLEVISNARQVFVDRVISYIE